MQKRPTILSILLTKAAHIVCMWVLDILRECGEYIYIYTYVSIRVYYICHTKYMCHVACMQMSSITYECGGYICAYLYVSYRVYDICHTQNAMYMCRVACVRVLGIL